MEAGVVASGPTWDRLEDQIGWYDRKSWMGYRSTCEALKHEKHLYLTQPGPYTDPAAAPRILAPRRASTARTLLWVCAAGTFAPRR
jgi:hypothetical protein